MTSAREFHQSGLEPFDAGPLPATLKGLAQRAVGEPLHRLGQLGLSLLDGQLPLPVAILKESALAHNGRWMRDFASRSGVSLCPHGKTTMSPQLFSRQLADGCWGITAATACQVRTYRQFGVKRILLANQLVGAANIDLVLDVLETGDDVDFYLLIDSQPGLDQLVEAVRRRAMAKPVQVLLEVGAFGGRTGVRSLDQGLELGRAIHRSRPWISLRGIEAYEGVVSGQAHAGVELKVHEMLDTVLALAAAGIEEQWFAPGEVIVTAGGSAFFDVVAAVLKAVNAAPFRVVLRSGCYLSHDALYYERMQARMRQRAGQVWGSGPGLQNALEVWSVVQSVPEPTRAIVALGKRDVSYDIELPQPLRWFRPGLHVLPQGPVAGVRVTQLNDQHAYVDASGDSMLFKVGDLVGFGVAHPCTTFDKWPLLYTVDDQYQVVGGVRTYF